MSLTKKVLRKTYPIFRLFIAFIIIASIPYLFNVLQTLTEADVGVDQLLIADGALELHAETTDFIETVPAFTIVNREPLWEQVQGIIQNNQEDFANSLTVTVTYADNTTVTPIIEVLESGTVSLKFPETLRPGVYTIKVATESETVETVFSWGVVAMNTNKQEYEVGESAKIGMAVLDEVGEMVCDATINLRVTHQSQNLTFNLSTTNGTINATEMCSKKEFTLQPDYESSITLIDEGVYHLDAEIIVKGHTFTIKREITVTNEQVFELERIGPTRIYPPLTYPMTIRIKPTQTFTGSITESIPDSFKIHDTAIKIIEQREDILENGTTQTVTFVESTLDPLNNAVVTENENNKQITWTNTYEAGKLYELQYTFTTPEKSPEFFSLKPLVIKTGESQLYQENEPWHIVIDAITRGATISPWITSDTTTGPSGTAYAHTVDSSTTLLVVTIGMDADESISVAPAWNGSETMTLIHATTSSGNSADQRVYTYGLVNPTATSNYITFTMTSDNHAYAVAVNYLGTITSSVDDATNLVDETVNDSASTTTVLASGGTSGATLFASAVFEGGDGDTASNNASFAELADTATGTSTTGADDAFYVADLIGGAPSGVTIDWAGSVSDENAGHLIEILPQPLYTISGTVYASEGGSNIGANKTVDLRVNGAGTYTDETDSSGVWSIANVAVTSGQVITVYIDDETEKGTTTYVSDGSSKSDVDIYSGVVIVRHDTGSSIIPDNLYTGDDGDSDVRYSVSAASNGNLSLNTNTELHIWTGDTFDSSGGTLTLSGSGSLHVDDSATAILDTSTNTIGGDLVVDGGATVSINANTTINGGDITTSGTSAVVDTTSGTPTVTISGTGSIGGGTTPTLEFHNLSSVGSGTTTISSTTTINNNLSVGDDFCTFIIAATTTVTNDVSVAATCALTVSADLNINGGDLTKSSSGTIGYTNTPTVTIAGTGNLGGGNSGGMTFYNLVLNGASQTTTLSSTNSIIANSLTVGTSHTFAMGTNSLTLGSTSIAGSGDLTVNGATSHSASGTLVVTGNGTAASWGGSGELDVYNLTIGIDGFTSGVDNEAGDLVIDIANNFTITADATFSASSTALFTVAGNILDSGTFDSGLGTVTMDASDSGNTIDTGSTFYNLNFNNASGSWSFGTTNTINVENNFTISAATAVTAPSTTLTVKGDFTGGTSFAHNSATVSLEGAAGTTQVITGANGFHNLSATTTAHRTILFATNFAVGNSLTLTGTSCSALLIVKGSPSGTTFMIDNDGTGTETVDYIDLQDLDAANWVGNTFTASNSVDSGNNADVVVSAGSCEGTSSNTTPTGGSFQRKTFWDATNSRHWMFFHDGDQIDIKYTSDAGSNWTTISSLAYDTNDFSVWNKKVSTTEYVFLAVADSNDIKLRVGTLSGTNITWDGDVGVPFDGTGASDTYANPYVSTDSSDYIWVGAKFYNGTNHVYKAVDSVSVGTTDLSTQTWNTASQISNDQTNSNVFGNIVPLASQDMYATFVVDTAIVGCMWDSSATSWINSSGGACAPVAGGSGESEYFDSLETDLSGYWKLNQSSWNGTTGEVLDASGNENDGTASGNATTHASGFERSGTFDGTGDYVTIPSGFQVASLEGTMSAWVYPVEAGGGYDIVASGVSNNDFRFSPINNLYGFFISSEYRVSYGTDPTQNTWTLVTLTWDQTNGSILYFNGVRVASNSTPPPAYSQTGLKIGSRPDGGSDYLEGRVDDVRAYSRALSAEEVGKLYQFVPESVNIDDASDFGPMSSAGRQIVRTKSGTLYSFLNDGGNCEIWKSTNGVNWAQQQSGTTITCGNGKAIAAAIDNNQDIHVIYNNAATVRYRNFDTATDNWDGGGEETIGSSDTYTAPRDYSIAVDTSNIPHVVLISDTVSDTVYYNNRIGGSWNANSTSVESGGALYRSDIVINGSGVPEISYYNATASDLTAALGNQNDASSFTLYDVDTDMTTDTSIAIDTLTGNTWIAYKDGTNNYISLAKYTGDHSSGQWNGTYWTTITSKSDVGTEPSIAITGSSDIYVFYQEDSTDQKIAYDVYDSDAGSPAWAGEIVLETPGNGVDFMNVDVKSAYEWNNYGSNSLDYLYSDGTDIYYSSVFLRRMPTNIDNASDFLYTSSGRQILRNSNGVLYTFLHDAGSCEIWRSTDNGFNWAEQDASNNPSCLASVHPIGLAIDSTDVIHIVYRDISTAGINYSTFSTVSNLFGTPESIEAQIGSSENYISLSIDNNDKPHVAWHDSNGTGAALGINYRNKVTGLWSTYISLSDNISIGKVNLTITDDNIPEVIFIDDGNDLTASVGDDNNPSSFTSYEVDTSVDGTDGIAGASVGVDYLGNTWIAYVDASTNYINLISHNDADSWTTWQSVVSNSNVGYEPSIFLSGSDIYVFYENNQDDIVYDIYNGSNWSGETVLEMHGALQDVKPRWSYINNYNSSGTAPIQTNTYYFNASDTSVSDPNSVWTNDSNGFDGDISTSANSSGTSTTSSNFLMGEGTNSPTSGGTIVNVKVRLYGCLIVSVPADASMTATIYTNGLAENLGSALKPEDVGSCLASWGSYTTLSTPSGGWTWQKINDLEVKITSGGASANSITIFKTEVLVESTNNIAQSEIDYVYSDATDVFYNRLLLSGSTPGTQDTIDTTLNGAAYSISTVSDTTNYDVHLTYYDDESTDQVSYKRWNNSGTPSWDGSPINLVSSNIKGYPNISYDTSGHNLYAFWIDSSNNYIKYRLCDVTDPTDCSTGGNWAAATNWQTTGTNTFLTTSHTEASKVFGQWTDGTSAPVNVQWAEISIGGGGNTAPDNPTSLAQKKTNDTVLATGDWTNESSVKFTATATDTDNPDTLYLCIEKDQLGTAFSNTEDSCGSGVAYSGSGVTVTHTISGLTDGVEYHWQARIKDDVGDYSSWVAYGGNAESARDFGVDTSAPTGGNVYDHTTTGVDKDFNDGSLSQLSGNWDGFNAGASGLNKYEYSIGTSVGGTQIKNWTDVATSTAETATGLTLQTSVLYYWNVRITDNAGNTATVTSDGQVVAPTLVFGVSSSTLTFSNLNAGNSYTDASKTTTLTTSTNAYNGYVVRAFKTSLLTSQYADTIASFSGGSYASPDEWLGGDTGFGYTSNDTSVQGSNLFGSTPCAGGGNPPCYAPFSQTGPGDIVADHTSTVSGTPITNEAFIVTYRVTTPSTQEAGVYSTTIVYTATPQY